MDWDYLHKNGNSHSYSKYQSSKQATNQEQPGSLQAWSCSLFLWNTSQPSSRNNRVALVKRLLSKSEVQPRPHQASNTGLSWKPFLPSTAAHNGLPQRKILVSFLKLCSFSGTVFWGLWFSAKRNLKNKTLVHYIMAPVMSRNILHLIKSPQITF